MRKTTFHVLVAASFATGLAAAGCADGGGPPMRESSVTVGMAGSAFSVKTLDARAGASIRFLNDDQDDHQVFVPTFGYGVDLGPQKPGTVATLHLGRPGRFRVECVQHPAMLIDVTVTP
jgi:plastocyanin